MTLQRLFCVSAMLLIPVVLAGCAPETDPAATSAQTSVATAPGKPAAPGPQALPARDPEALAATVAEAAKARDYAALAEHMADAFSYSFGHEPSREGGLEAFRSDPERLDLLAGILGRDCVRDSLAGEHWYICPAAAADEKQAYYGWRAGFRQRDDGRWEFVWFIAGD